MVCFGSRSYLHRGGVPLVYTLHFRPSWLCTIHRMVQDDGAKTFYQVVLIADFDCIASLKSRNVIHIEGSSALRNLLLKHCGRQLRDWNRCGRGWSCTR